MIFYGDSQDVKDWMIDRFPDNKYFLPFATICEVKNGKILAAVWVENYTGRSAVIHVCGEKGWCTRKFLTAVFDYCFNQLNLYKIIGTVSSSNVRANEFDMRLGFVRECVIKDTESNGDTIIYTMTKQQCKFLRSHNGQESTKSARSI